MHDMTANKAAIRREYLARRSAIPANYKADYDRRLADAFILLPEFQRAAMVICTLSTQEEMDTRPIIEAARIAGKLVAVPRCMPGHRMRFYYYDDNTTVEYSRFGIPEPVLTSRAVDDFSGSVCLVPAICADRDNYRLGYGGGYYDRFLKDYEGFSATLVYPGFLLEDRLPREATDQPIDQVITLF